MWDACGADGRGDRRGGGMNGDWFSLGILVNSVSREGGGVFNAVRLGAIALADLGCATHIYAPMDGQSHHDLPAWQPLRPELFAMRGPRFISYAPGLSRALRGRPHDVLHLHGLWQYQSISASMWRRRTGRPVMISPHGMLDPWALRNSGWKKRLARLLFEDTNLRGAACLHALTESEAASMRSLGLSNPIAVIPNGIDLPAEGKSYRRPAWLPDDGRRLLLYIGRFHHKKGLRELMAAWAELKRLAPDTASAWRLVIAGGDDGDVARVLAADAAAHDLSDDVMLPGAVYGSVKSALLSAAAAFILPSYSEGLPMAILEAWTHTCPVFMTAACNLPEGFAAGAAVEISTDPAATARTLAEHLMDPNLAERGRSGRELVANRFDPKQIAQDHLSVYRWMVSGGTPPDSVRLT